MTTTQEVASLLRNLRREARLPERNRERQEWLARKAAILERIERGGTARVEAQRA